MSSKYRVVRDGEGWGVTDCPEWQKIPILENNEAMTRSEAEAMAEELNQPGGPGRRLRERTDAE